MILEICACIATLAFAILVIYLVQTLISLQLTLSKTDELLSRVDHNIEPIATEALKILSNSSELTESVKDQLAAFTPLTQSISNMGQTLQDVTTPAEESMTWHQKIINGEKTKVRQENFRTIIELFSLGLSLWNQFKKRR